jgi:hypothetical protein
MTKILNILIIIFLGLTIFLIIVHLKEEEHLIISETGKSRIELYNNEFKCSAYLIQNDEDKIIVNLSFHHNEAAYKIIGILVRLNNLEPLSIKPFHGMKTWDNPEYGNFDKIPDSLKFLSTQSNPYYAFEHVFKVNNELNKFNLYLEVITQEKGQIISKEVEIIKNKTIELKPWDMHSDITFLFIPLFTLLSLILILIKVILLIRRKIKSA